MTVRIAKQAAAPTTAMLPLPVDVDLVRFETNLLQIGFFSAQDPRSKRSTTRRLEQTVTRDGQRIRVTAEFRASELLGLPSTADRDKFLALMKLVSEERARVGRVENPIRFTGYRLLKELGHSDSGQNYEDLSNWGRRMADTTITSEKVIYFSSKKKYTDKTIHVFRSFQRVGESNLDNSDRSEAFEVELEDWLLENLNNGYVVPEDFRAYKALTRPTAKGIFGNLHLWFHASLGKVVEKDYTELCNFLNVRAYPHASKIRETMGQSLDELVGVGYLASWQIQPMATKKGFKLVLAPGVELQRVMAFSSRKQLADKTGSAELTAGQQNAVEAMLENGIAPAKAKTLAQQYDVELILDQIEYAQSQMSTDISGRQKITNPAGFIIYTIENALPVPASFLTSRKKRQLEAEQDRERENLVLTRKHLEWKESLVAAEVNARFPGKELDHKLEAIITQRKQAKDEYFCVMPSPFMRKLALTILKKELASELSLPEFQEWAKQRKQGNLF